MGDEHVKGSKESKAFSRFHFVYPSKTSTRAEKRDNQGVFGNFLEVIASRFHPATTLLDKDYTEGGILILSDADEQNIK